MKTVTRCNEEKEGGNHKESKKRKVNKKKEKD